MKNENAKMRKCENAKTASVKRQRSSLIQTGVYELNVSRCQSSSWIPAHTLEQDSDCFELSVAETQILREQKPGL
jgi:hypothetical protein